eukprot:TRINITY_DN9467_c0_g1_i2.p1 TRINITY_DN9467_c0_g1~~TRINITY_DN9467_c0_g1_i2.p1  ORF type:complete len:266 (+),score=41.43 TRINITY_DN9467_c0_g1_i2:114-800(+)
MKAAALIAFAVGAAANCPLRNYTCCSQWDFFIPVGETCIENEPSQVPFLPGKDNCARNGMSPVAWWARFEDPEWRKQGVCTNVTKTITRADLEKRERHDAEFKANYTYWCDQNHAGCSLDTEDCYYDRLRVFPNGGQVWSGEIEEMGPVCKCSWRSAGETARLNTDGTGPCVVCKNPYNGTNESYLQYVQRSPGDPKDAGAKSFKNGDFACAYGKASDISTEAASILV